MLGNFLDIPRVWITSLSGRTCTTRFLKECSKIPNTLQVGFKKKFMKLECILLFMFVNRVLFPQKETKIFATLTYIYLIETLSKFEPIDLSTLIIEHLFKTLIEREGMYGMWYVYFLMKEFDHLHIPVGTTKQDFTMNTLIKYKCIEGKV